MENFPKLPQTFEATDCPDGIPLRDFDCTLKNCSQEMVIILVRKWVGSTSKKQMRMCGLTSSKVHNIVDKIIFKL